MTNRIYVVTDGDESTYLVRAGNRAQAMRHVARRTFDARLASQDDLIELIPTHVVEDATVDAEPGE